MVFDFNNLQLKRLCLCIRHIMSCHFIITKDQPVQYH